MKKIGDPLQNDFGTLSENYFFELVGDSFEFIRVKLYQVDEVTLCICGLQFKQVHRLLSSQRLPQCGRKTTNSIRQIIIFFLKAISSKGINE